MKVLLYYVLLMKCLSEKKEIVKITCWYFVVSILKMSVQRHPSQNFKSSLCMNTWEQCKLHN